MKLTRQEYPRPQLRRKEWVPLNGEWDCCFDVGVKIPAAAAFDKKINVPFTYEYEASGIGDKTPRTSVWYRRKFTVNAHKKRVLLCFNASDYITDVWINGNHAITHVGGFTPFQTDITPYLFKKGENEIVVHCQDPLDPTIPRGKQSWTGKPFGCWYTPNTGIWQSVWLELFGDDCIAGYFATPDIDNCCFYGEITSLYGTAESAVIEAYLGGKLYKRQSFSLDGRHTRYCVKFMEEDFVDETLLWSPDKPTLFDIEIKLYCGGREVDGVSTRLGMRKISVDGGGNICLNNKPLYQRLILDQGYWRESGLTPPSAEALKEDIILAKRAGFNGARKHQKLEDPYFYYYADELGFLTWCEMPSAYNFNASEISLQSGEWQKIIAAARNFASVICYVPLNESWGVRKILTDPNQQDYARAMYYITKATDDSRLVSTNDGWENIDATDIISIHDYAFDGSAFAEKYASGNLDGVYPATRRLMAEGCLYGGQPVIFSEFGGIALKGAKDGDWGYNEGAATEEEFFARVENLLSGIRGCNFQGFCYTQLTDVQQEVNGILYENRTPKFDLDKLSKIIKK